VSVDLFGDTEPIAVQSARIKHVDVERLIVSRDCDDGGVYSRAAEHLSISSNVVRARVYERGCLSALIAHAWLMC